MQPDWPDGGRGGTAADDGAQDRGRTRDGALPIVTGIAHFLAHELGNAGSALALTLDLLSRQEGMPERARTLVGRCRDLQQRLQTIIDALGTLGGARVGRKVNLRSAALVEELVSKLKLRERFDIEIEIDTPEHPGTVHADASLLELALRLLLQNAVEATPPGARLGVTSSATADGTRLTVWDEGKGISPEHRDGLFARVLPSGKGVGLLLVRAIVEKAHGGRVAFSPNQPRGACFHLEFPSEEATSARPLTAPVR